MQPATQIDWLERTRQHMAAGSTDMADAVARIETTRYTDPARLEREERLLFRRFPMAVSFSSKLAQPGDVVTHDLLGLPILLTRAHDGRLHAFLNVCRHRGSKLVWERSSCGRRALVCPYHAWTYDLAGGLRGIPHEEGFSGIDKAQHNLVALPVAEAFGIVFVVPQPISGPGAGYDFAGFFGAIGKDLESFGLGSHVLYDEREIGVASNWKVVVEGGLETYHVRHAHKSTIAPMFADNVAVADRCDPHARLYFIKRAAKDLHGQPLDGRSVRDYGNPLYYIFPNLIILVQPDHATVMTVFPHGTDACLIHGGALIPEAAASEKARLYWDKNVKIFWDALNEDFQMGQAIQSGFRAGANSHITFGRFEQGCAWFHDSVDRALA